MDSKVKGTFISKVDKNVKENLAGYVIIGIAIAGLLYLLATAHIWAPVLILIGFLGWLLISDSDSFSDSFFSTPVSLPPNPMEIFATAIHTINNIKGHIGVSTITNITQICGLPPITVINGITIYHLRILKKSGGIPMTRAELDNIRNLIQSEMQNFYPLYLINICDSGVYLHISLAYAHSKEVHLHCRKYIDKKFNKPHMLKVFEDL